MQAIQYCHELHVVHRDLKPENVVFFQRLGLVKLTDFGFSNKFDPGEQLQTSCGSLAYSAPEILLGDSYDAPAVDIWSLGVILYMLVCGAAPFQEANDSETLTMIMDCKYSFPNHISTACKKLVSLMLQRQPHLRASLEDIIKDPWLNESSNEESTFIDAKEGAGNLPLVSREHLSEEEHSNHQRDSSPARLDPTAALASGREASGHEQDDDDTDNSDDGERSPPRKRAKPSGKGKGHSQSTASTSQRRDNHERRPRPVVHQTRSPGRRRLQEATP